MVVALAWAAIYRQLRRMGRLTGDAFSAARMPPEQRQRIYSLKETASRLTVSLMRSSPDPVFCRELVTSLRSDSEALLEHPLLANACGLYAFTAEIILAGKLGKLSPTGEPIQDVGVDIEKFFRLLAAIANLALIEHPPPKGS